MARTYYKVLYNFDGTTGKNMIAVEAGEVVYSDEEQKNKNWYSVTRAKDGVTGLVPATYVEEVPAADVAGQTQSAPEIPPVEPQSQANSLAINDLSAVPTATMSTGTAGNTEALPASFAEMFQRHDAYFRQVVKQREEAFKKLEAALSAASKDIAACKEKNAKLTQRITELDSLIEEERRKWRERLENEKRSLFKSIQ